MCIRDSMWSTPLRTRYDNGRRTPLVTENMQPERTTCVNQSGQTRARHEADKEEISSDGSPEQTCSVDNKTFKHLLVYTS